MFVGNKEKQLFDNLLLSEKVNLELQGTENAEHGCLSLRYAVKIRISAAYFKKCLLGQCPKGSISSWLAAVLK